MTKDKATKPRSLTDDSLPLGFSAATHESGRTYYIDHNTRTTSWLHPRGAQLAKPLTPGLPYPYERDFNENGRAYYLNHRTQTTSWLNPVKLAELKATGILDIKMDERVTRGEAGNGWPWIVKETVECGPRQGEEYWVNYRLACVNNRSPEYRKGVYLANAKLKAKVMAAWERRGETWRKAKL